MNQQNGGMMRLVIGLIVGIILGLGLGLLFGYVNDTDEQAKFAVVIAPQSGDQDSAIAALLPDVEKTEVAGGSVYMVGSYYSQDYADVICNQYRALGFFTIDIVHESPETA